MMGEMGGVIKLCKQGKQNTFLAFSETRVSDFLESKYSLPKQAKEERKKDK